MEQRILVALVIRRMVDLAVADLEMVIMVVGKEIWLQTHLLLHLNKEMMEALLQVLDLEVVLVVEDLIPVVVVEVEVEPSLVMKELVMEETDSLHLLMENL